MKILNRNKKGISRRGLLVTIMVFMLGVSANTIAIKYFEDSTDHYMSVRVAADGFRARQMALAGFHAALMALKTVPEEYLFQYGITTQKQNEIELSEDCRPNCMLSFNMHPEDGKLNVNNLVNVDKDETNNQWRTIFERFFRGYDMEEPDILVNSLIDWIDENSTPEAGGAEDTYYITEIKPPLKIKNYRLFTLSEIAQVRGFSRNLIYTSQAPEDWAEIQKELKFQTEEEKQLIQDPDWIPSNHMTAFIPIDNNYNDKININTARYHTLMSLSDLMTKAAVKALFKLRNENGNYIKDLAKLQDLEEFQEKEGEFTLYQILAGSGSSVSGLLKTKGEIYRITGFGSIYPKTDNTGIEPVVRVVTGLYDLTNKKLMFYRED